MEFEFTMIKKGVEEKISIDAQDSLEALIKAISKAKELSMNIILK